MLKDISRRKVLMIAGAALAGAGISALKADAEPAGSSRVVAEDAEFKGKVVALTLKEPAKGMYLKDVHLKRLAERAFLVGTYASRADTDEFPEMVYWIPVDKIEMITVFNSMEDAKKAYNLRQKREK